MFIVSLRMNRKNKIASLGVVVLVLFGIIFMATGKAGSSAQVNAKGKNDQTNSSASTSKAAENSEDVATFLKSFGWEVESEAVEIQQVVIPTEFNDVYTQYNVIQKKQGYNLEQFRGATVQRYSFEIKNYPNRPENIRANVLVNDQTIIGGDISCLELDGFVHGFEPQ